MIKLSRGSAGLFVKPQRKAQGMLEYLILTALIALLCMAAVKKLGERMETRIENTAKRIVEDIPRDMRNFHD